MGLCRLVAFQGASKGFKRILVDFREVPRDLLEVSGIGIHEGLMGFKRASEGFEGTSQHVVG